MRRLASGFLVAAAMLAACDNIDTKRTVEPYSSFGAAVYRESCQRVAYTGQLAQKDAGLRKTVDVSGQYGRAVCVDGNPPPADAPPVLTAIVGQKDALIAVVDAILPKDFLDTLENFLEQILPLSDPVGGPMESAIKQLAAVLGTMGDDPDFSPALARLALRNGYRPTRTAAGLVRTIVNYQGIDDFIGKTLSMIAPGGTAEAEWKQLLTAGAMALTTMQPVAQTGDPDRTLKLALNLLTSRHPDLATGTARPLVARDFRGMATVSVVNGTVVAPFVDMDKDGLADVDADGHYIDAKGQVIVPPSPFPELGATDNTPRDALGRVLVDPKLTNTVYQYLDLDGTVFGGLAHETLDLMDPDPKKDIPFGLMWGAGALLGPRATQTQMYMDSMGGMIGSLTYNGFDTKQAAILDLVHGLLQVLGDPGADQTFQSVYTLLNQYESPTARLVGAMLAASDTGKQYPNAVVPAQSVVFDDLMVIVNRILAIPGLADDLFDALEDPRVQDFAPMMARLMMARNQVDFVRHATDFPLLQGGHDLDVIDPVDRTQPDVDDAKTMNRSLMQRIAHIIHDSNGVKMCNKAGATALGAGPYDKCKMFEIDDLALFYVLNMQTDASKGPITSAKDGADFCKHLTIGTVLQDPLGQLLIGGCNGGLLPSTAGVDGFGQFPTPKALNRALFLKQNEKPTTALGGAFLANTTEDVLCADGDKFIDVHDKSLMAWEATLPGSHVANATFYTAVAPMVDAFAKHDECTNPADPGTCHNAAKIFVDLLAMLHTHWASPNSSYFGHTYQSTSPAQPRFAHTDNIVSYEPLLANVLGQGDLVPAVLDFEPKLKLIKVTLGSTTITARDALRASANYLFQFGGAPGIAYRDGTTKVVMSDGVTPVKQLTPYYLIADAYAHKRNALSMGNADQVAAWKRATSALVDQFLTVEHTATGYQFANRRFRAISLIVINFLRGRMDVHRQAQDLDEWVHHTLTDDLTEKLSGPTFAALADFTQKIEADDDARTQLYKLFQYLVDEADNDSVFQTALTTLADQVQMFLDDPDLVPVARVLGSALDPTRGAVDAQLTLTKKTHDLDTNKALLTILRNLYKQDDVTSVYPASKLADVLSELNRAQPGHGGDLTGDDYRSILKATQSFLTDEQRGFMRFVNIVRTRGPN
jgi:hypothetical protein